MVLVLASVQSDFIDAGLKGPLREFLSHGGRGVFVASMGRLVAKFGIQCACGLCVQPPGTVSDHSGTPDIGFLPLRSGSSHHVKAYFAGNE